MAPTGSKRKKTLDEGSMYPLKRQQHHNDKNGSSREIHRVSTNKEKALSLLEECYGFFYGVVLMPPHMTCLDFNNVQKVRHNWKILRHCGGVYNKWKQYWIFNVRRLLEMRIKKLRKHNLVVHIDPRPWKGFTVVNEDNYQQDALTLMGGTYDSIKKIGSLIP